MMQGALWWCGLKGGNALHLLELSAVIVNRRFVAQRFDPLLNDALLPLCQEFLVQLFAL